MKLIRIYLLAVMFFMFSSVYARADEKQGSNPVSLYGARVKSQAPNVTSQDSRLTTQDLKLRTQDSGFVGVDNRSNTQDSLSRYVDFLNKWVSLSFEKEKSGIYFSMAF